MTTKPSPATCGCSTANGRLLCREVEGCIANTVRGLEHALAESQALILPSACSLSHAPIRYTGDKCPLCEALKLADKRLFSFYQLWDLADRAVGGDITETQFVDGRKEIITALSLVPSRPSEAPAPKPDHIFCGDSDDPAAICDQSDCDRPLSEHTPEFAPKPGAGEEGK